MSVVTTNATIYNGTTLVPASSGGDKNQQDSVAYVVTSAVTIALCFFTVVIWFLIVAFACRSEHVRYWEERQARIGDSRDSDCQRREFVSSHLLVRPYQSEDLQPKARIPLDEAVIDGDMASTTTDPPDLESDVDGTSSNSYPYDDRAGCIICLTSFELNQLICESSNSTCPHIFHQKCMEKWLQKHERCPVCREVYLLQTAEVK